MNHDGARIRKLRAIKLCIIAIGHFKNDALDILVKPEFGELAHPSTKRQCILNAADSAWSSFGYVLDDEQLFILCQPNRTGVLPLIAEHHVVRPTCL